MNASEQFDYWKQKFINLDLYKNYQKKIEVFGGENLIVYRFHTKDDHFTCFKIDCFGNYEYEFSVWKLHEEDEYFPLTEEGFKQAVKYFEARL